ncbi:MAG: hypothetical protein WAV54_02280 [Acidimicrobiales bacterium]
MRNRMTAHVDLASGAERAEKSAGIRIALGHRCEILVLSFE